MYFSQSTWQALYAGRWLQLRLPSAWFLGSLIRDHSYMVCCLHVQCMCSAVNVSMGQSLCIGLKWLNNAHSNLYLFLFAFLPRKLWSDPPSADHNYPLTFLLSLYAVPPTYPGQAGASLSSYLEVVLSSQHWIAYFCISDWMGRECEVSSRQTNTSEHKKGLYTTGLMWILYDANLHILSLPIDLHGILTCSIDKWLFHVSSIEVIHSSVAIDLLHAAE